MATEWTHENNFSSKTCSTFGQPTVVEIDWESYSQEKIRELAGESLIIQAQAGIRATIKKGQPAPEKITLPMKKAVVKTVVKPWPEMSREEQVAFMATMPENIQNLLRPTMKVA